MLDQVFFIERGQVVLYAETPQQPQVVQRVLLKAGACLTLLPEEWHELRNESDEDAVLLYFGVLAAQAGSGSGSSGGGDSSSKQ